MPKKIQARASTKAHRSSATRAVQGKAVSSPASIPKSGSRVKPGKSRVTNVGQAILAKLEKGPMDATSLVREGGFAASSLYLNLPILRSAGAIEIHKVGRRSMYSLPSVGISAMGKKGDSARPSKKSAESISTSKLFEELRTFQARCAPIRKSKEKRQVLEQLAKTCPASVSALLLEIRDDILRISKQAPPVA